MIGRDTSSDLSLSSGFHLVINVTDPSRDLAGKPVHGRYVSSIHIDPPHNLLGASSSERGRIFYQNGSWEEGISLCSRDPRTYSREPAIIYGLTTRLDEGSSDVSTLRLDVGPGQAGLNIAKHPEGPASVVNLDNLAVCNEAVPYYSGKKLSILKQFLNRTGGGFIPQDCAPVSLIPECMKINSFQKGTLAGLEHVLPSFCYKDVSAIDWVKRPVSGRDLDE